LAERTHDKGDAVGAQGGAGAGFPLVLKVVAGRASGMVLEVGDEPLVLGRDAPGDARLGGDPELSRQHLRVSRFDGDRLLVEDLKSTNGTFVNGGEVAGPTVVGAEDAIWLGTTTLLVQSPAAALPEIPPSAPPTPSPQGGLLSRLADLSARHPKRMLGGVGVFLLIAIAVGGPTPKLLRDNQGFEDRASTSYKTYNNIAHYSGAYPEPMLTLVSSSGDITAPRGRAELTAIEAQISSGKDIASCTGATCFHGKRIFDAFNTGDPFFLSRDRREALIATFFQGAAQQAREDSATSLKKKLEHNPDVLSGGGPVLYPEVRNQVSKDLGMAELLVFPILFVLSLFVFRGVVAALLPMLVGAITVFGTFLALRIVNLFIPVNIFALNLVIGLGIGLSIDYTLFMVSRYREELVRVGAGRPPNEAYGATPVSPAGAPGSAFIGSQTEAVRRTVLTAGRTILFSSTMVAVAVLSLVIFRQPFVYSMGIGGFCCAIVAVLVSLFVLPSMFMLLGPRINAGAPRRWREANLRTASRERSGAWYRLARAVMGRPLVVAVSASAVLLSAGYAFTQIKYIGVNASVLPTSLTARQLDKRVEADFPANPSAQIELLVDAPANAGPTIQSYVNSIGKLRDVAFIPPARKLAGDHWLVSVQPWGDGLSTPVKELTKTLTARAGPFPMQVTGQAADYLDQGKSFREHLPFAFVLLALITIVVLFLMTGSVVLPVKALIMNLLTVSATLGLLVLVFQDGRFQSLLDYHSVGAIDSTQPILIVAIAFGLSTDYAVFLLTRINEARIEGATSNEAVAIGLERTGRIVTQAALLFCVAVAAFATSEVIYIKEVGLGMGAAVIIDSTIVRALLVPSLMAMLGTRNWWAPGPLRRLHNKIGLSEL